MASHPNHLHQKQNRADKSTLFVYGGDSWNQNRPSRCSGYKLLSAPVGRYRGKTFCLTCNLHIVSHPNNLRQKQNRADKSTLFVYGGDSWNLNLAPQAGQQTALRSRWSLHIGGFLLRLQFAHGFSSKQSPPKTKQSR
jgi:hypothetical protein